MRRCHGLVCLALLFVTLHANLIRTKRRSEDNFNDLLNLYKINPLKQSNVFKSFSDRILLPRQSPDSNYNAKESGEEKKVNTNRSKEIDTTTNIADRNITEKIKDDNIKITMSIQKDMDKVDDAKLIHDLNIKLDTMSAEIMNILDFLQDNNTQTRKQEFNIQHFSKNVKVENVSALNFNNYTLHNSSQIDKTTEITENKELVTQRSVVFQKNNISQYKISNFKKHTQDLLNYPPGNISQSQNFAQISEMAEESKSKPLSTSTPEFKFYSEQYLKNTIFYDDYFDNERAYKVQDNAITDKEKYVNAEVVIF